MNRDLTVGKPESVLWRFCLPLFGSIVFQQLYNIADSLVAGKFVGENALAAVGNSYEITLIFIAFAFGCNIGLLCDCLPAFRCEGLLPHENGRPHGHGLQCGSLRPADAFGAFWKPSFAGMDQHARRDSGRFPSFTWISISGGFPLCSFTTSATGILSRPWAIPGRRSSSWAVSSLSNIGMDIWFVTAFHMGVAGVAWATFPLSGSKLCTGGGRGIQTALQDTPSGENSPPFPDKFLKTLPLSPFPVFCSKALSLSEIF